MKKRYIMLSFVILLILGVVPIKALAFDNTGWYWPVPDSKHMSQGYWYNNEDDNHRAIDINASQSGVIVAARSGTVVVVYDGCNQSPGLNKDHSTCSPVAHHFTLGDKWGLKYNGICNYGFGRGVVIDHGNGVLTEYAHMSSVSVSVGQKVEAGKQIGLIGAYGAADGPHLHFSIWTDANMNGWYPSGNRVNNNPYGSEYICTGSWNGVDNIYYTVSSSTNPVTPTVSFSPWSNDNYTYVYWTDAGIGQEINVSGGTCTKLGMYLYDANGNYLAEASQTEYFYRIYFKINEECHYTLTPGTIYKYRFYAIVNGKTYWGNEYSFKTDGPAPTYTVSYNSNGGSGAPSSQVKTHDITLTLSSTVPTRTGYIFLGWGTSASAISAAYPAGGSYTKNAAATLYAVWSPIEYTIYYNANGGNGAPSSQFKTYGIALTLSSTVPTRTGYSFEGWGTSASATTAAYWAGGSYTANAAATLFAVWKPYTYSVSLNANGGTLGQFSMPATYGTAYGDLPEPTREGYQFDGWYTANTGGSRVGNTTIVTTASNHTLYARWNEITMLTLPASLKRIEDESFMGFASESVVIPVQCTYIGSKAFANCGDLLYVYFPQKDITIQSDAFSGCAKVTFICHEGSSAQSYAVDSGIPYRLY